MQLDLTVTSTRASTPVCASIYHGKIVCFGQKYTYSICSDRMDNDPDVALG